MHTLILLSVLVCCGLSLPADPAFKDPTPVDPVDPDQPTDLPPPEYQRDLIVVSYINNFKNFMTEYVKSQYKDLTVDEIEKIKLTIELFLTNFAKDLRDVIELHQEANKASTNESVDETRVRAENNESLEPIEDGLTDAQFDDIRDKIRAEFPQITEKAAQDIVVRLRKNLLVTRQKIDLIIRDSQRAQQMYS